MIKKVFIIVIFSFIFLLCFTNNIRANIASKDTNKFEIELYKSSGIGLSINEKKTALSVLQKTFGYSGDRIILGRDTMKFRTKITVKKVFKKGYSIQIGEDQNEQDDEFQPLTIPNTIFGWFDSFSVVSFNDLQSKYGYTGKEEEIKVGTTWNVVLIGGAVEASWNSGSGNTESGNEVEVKAYELYSGDDYQTGENKEVSDGTDVLETETVGEAIDEVIKESFGEIIGKFFMMILDVFRAVFADGPQMIINTLQTSNYSEGLNKLKPWAITYKPSDILKDSNKNSYVNYSKKGKNEGSAGQIPKHVNAEENGFTKKSPIPIIPMDLYYIASGQIAEFDVHFLNTTDLENQSDWIKMRNKFITGFLHIIFYLCSAFLLVTLIWHGINIVRHSIAPLEKAKHTNKINDFFIALIMLVGSILIINLCTYFTDTILNSVKVAETNEAPVRVILEDENKIYSFSTTFTGYLRYMSDISKVSKINDKISYTLFYTICVWVNIIAVLAMFIRTIALMILSVAGPIIAVAYAINKETVAKIKYKDWIIHYIIWSSIQVGCAIVYKIILTVGF